MFVKSFALVFLASLVVAEIPSYIQICGRKNPNLDQCVLNSVDGLRDKLRDGMPELDVPPLDPLFLPGFRLSDTDTLKTRASNVTIQGLSDFVLKSVHVDLDKQTLDMVADFKKIILDADYNINLKLIAPIADKGPIHLVAEDVEAHSSMQWKLAKKNGAEYMYLPSMTMKLAVRDYQVDFTPSSGKDSPIAKAVNSAIQGGRQEIFQTFRPVIERVISEEVLKRANKICTHFTYDELYPDRE